MKSEDVEVLLDILRSMVEGDNAGVSGGGPIQCHCVYCCARHPGACCDEVHREVHKSDCEIVRARKLLGVVTNVKELLEVKPEIGFHFRDDS